MDFNVLLAILPFFTLLIASFWIWMLYDCFVHEAPLEKMILWLLVILFTNIVGALLYYFIRRPQRLEVLK